MVAWDEAPVTTVPGDRATARRRLYVERPHRWDPDDPYLYTCRVILSDDGEVLDEDATTFGIRSLSVDPTRGLLINGAELLLRGACVHHDNGLLGAATFDRAEERRVELLKAAGFNAIRSAHNPMSKPMLAACDRQGMLVMDETFDMWAEAKSEDDYALRFAQWWELDVEAMVRKDLNHPSVILYSIGNEIPEAGRPDGARIGRAVAEKIRSLDGTRLVTQAISGLLAGGPELIDELRTGLANRIPETDDHTGVNTAMTTLADQLNNLMVSETIARNSAETISYLDVAGYNYMESRYELDHDRYPNRVIVGSETHPAAIDTLWAAVRRYPHVIGDFTWTGWDYLGEVGIGRTVYGEPDPSAGPPAFLGEFPWLTAWCGDIDITGHRRPQSYYREIVFGRRTDPYVVVRRPQFHGQPTSGTPWQWSDAVSTWSWEGFEQRPVTVEVYGDGDEVELLGQRPLARPAAGRPGPSLPSRIRDRVRTRPPRGRGLAWQRGARPHGSALRHRPGVARCPGGPAPDRRPPRRLGLRGPHAGGRPGSALQLRRSAGPGRGGGPRCAPRSGQCEPDRPGGLRGAHLHHIRRACPRRGPADG